MKRKDLSFFLVQENAKKCKRVRNGMKRKGIGLRKQMTMVLKGATPPLHA
jgi:hypothetical protein